MQHAQQLSSTRAAELLDVLGGRVHVGEQLREAGKLKMDELRSLKAAVVQAHAAAKLQQQQNTAGYMWGGLTTATDTDAMP
jgi:hypothetical protein